MALETLTLEGYGALFNVEAVIAGLFREKIAPGAFTETIARDDVRSLFNHDPSQVLGRKTVGTLTLREDKRGLYYSVQINADDAIAASVAARVTRRDVSGSSFWFAVDSPDDEVWEMDDRTKLPLRTLKRLRLIDVGPVTLPAYPTTTVTARSGARDQLELIRLRIAIAKAKAAWI